MTTKKTTISKMWLDSMCTFIMLERRNNDLQRLRSCNTSPTVDVDCWSFSICRTQSLRRSGGGRMNLEGLANIRLDELIIVRRHWLSYFSAGVTHCCHLSDACQRETEMSPETLQLLEVRAGRLCGSFRLRAHRTVPTRPVLSWGVHHGIFPDVFFFPFPDRPHERRANGVKERWSFCLCFHSLNTTLSNRMFSMC